MAFKVQETIFDRALRELEEQEGIAPHKMKVDNDKVEFGFPQALKDTVNMQMSSLAQRGGSGIKLNEPQKEAVAQGKKQLAMKASSTIQQAAYWPSKEYLIVSFKSGSTYSYNDVPLLTVLLWEQASSAGSWFYYNIRTSYNYQKMG